MRPTKPFLELPLESRRCPLPPAWRVKEVADAARSAALGFAWGANHGWDRRDLARWLAGPYAHALAPTKHIRRPLARPRVVRDEPIAEGTIRDLLLRSHARVVAILREAWSWSCDATFARSAVDAGLVVGVSDDAGGLGFAPASTPYMRLVDRVRSLFVADFLTRPHEYTTFGVCDACDAVSFDASGLHDGCTSARRVADQPPASRIVLRRRATLVGVGEPPPRRDTLRTLILPWQEPEADTMTG